MNSSISANTQAILLLTAPLITVRTGGTTHELLSPAEYRRFARRLRELGFSPGDLLGNASSELARELDSIIDAERVRRLLDRGFLVSQAIERWQTRAIWVMSRADTEYPKRIKNRLKEDSPAIVYGCGEPRLLESGGLAIVGSRHVDEALLEYTEAVGRQCAASEKIVISGAAPGVDRAAMRGALDGGGCAVGVLSDSLERTALNRENRDWLLSERLALVSPYDPNAGFNVGHAMQRNKIIYALADLALVVNAEFEKGGTWAGATEQLQTLRFVPVYVRSTGEIGPGLQALERDGARRWPNPSDSHEFLAVFDKASSESTNAQPKLAFQPDSDARKADLSNVATHSAPNEMSTDDSLVQQKNSERYRDVRTLLADDPLSSAPAEILIMYVRKILTGILTTPKTKPQIASLLEVSNSQAGIWLEKLIEEGLLEKTKKPTRYIVKRQMLI